MSENTQKTEAQSRIEQQQLQNTIQTVLEMEQSFKLYSYRIINTKDFINGVNAIFETYLKIQSKLQLDHERTTYKKATA